MAKRDKLFLPQTHPHLLEEWDYHKNRVLGLDPEKLTYGSGKKAAWICKTCGYNWPAIIYDRTNIKTPTGCPVCAGNVVSDKNRLSLLYPELAKEWHPTKNGDLKSGDVSYGSGKKVCWLCKECGHHWFAEIRSRAVCNRGCPACSGTVVTDKNRLSSLFPGLVEEWHPVKNIGLKPEDVSFGSHKKVWWLCSAIGCRHEWETSVSDRAGQGNGCPLCSGKVLSDKNRLSIRFPELAKEWHPARNGDLTPEDVSFGSRKKCWWGCGRGHVWESSIASRSLGRSCPYCANKKACNDNCLLSTNLELCEEWDYNKNTISPVDITAGSAKYVWWLCKYNNKHPSWKAVVYNRTVNNSGCPYCNGKKVCSENCLSTTHPNFSLEWSSINKVKPEEVTAGQNMGVWWVCICSDESHPPWKASISNRVLQGTGCPRCSINNVSKISQTWLDSLNIGGLIREHVVRVGDNSFRVDGYDPATNTIYEFLGDFWHGNPKVFPDGVNSVNKRKFSTLYKETVLKIDRLEKVGYKVVYIWESDFRNQAV